MISPKQKKILAFPYSRYDSLICDGAVRSGKTSILTVSFVVNRHFNSSHIVHYNIAQENKTLKAMKLQGFVVWRMNDFTIERMGLRVWPQC